MPIAGCRALVSTIAATLGLGLAIPITAANADTIDDVLKRQRLVCGVSQGLLGFSAKDGSGRWKGLDVDFCRAVSAAVLGDADKVDYVPLSAEERFDALKAGKIDVLSRNSTWTMSRDVVQGLEFVGVIYYDGQSFMVRSENGWTSAMEISGVAVCVQSGTTSVENAAAYFAQQGLKNELMKLATRAEVLAAYASKRCEAYTTDRSALAAERLSLDQPDAHVILPEVVSKEPLGPVVRKGDQNWAAVVRWVLFALIAAEEDGHTRAKLASAVPTGITVPPLSPKLPPNWYETTIRMVGNYGEIFDRNVGLGSPLGIERGVNALWTQGGLLYVPPLR
jgi:general L-amino acid transport system substrate-binding protein